MNIAIANTKRAIDDYRYDEYAHIIYHFVWDDFCDNFIELSKSEMDGENKDIILSTANIVIKNILRMLQPVIPFVSANIWNEMDFGDEADFINETYAKPVDVATQNTSDIDWMLNVISTIRNIRAENKIGFKTDIQIAFKTKPSNATNYIPLIEAHTNTKLAEISDDMISTVVDENTTLLVKLPSINKDEAKQKAQTELQEIEKRIASLTAQIAKMEGKAPANIIDDRKKSLDEAIKKKEQLNAIIKE